MRSRTVYVVVCQVLGYLTRVNCQTVCHNGVYTSATVDILRLLRHSCFCLSLNHACICPSPDEGQAEGVLPRLLHSLLGGVVRGSLLLSVGRIFADMKI